MDIYVFILITIIIVFVLYYIIQSNTTSENFFTNGIGCSKYDSEGEFIGYHSCDKDKIKCIYTNPG